MYFKIRTPSCRYVTFAHIRNFHNNSQSVVIAAAARTPWGKSKGQLAAVSAWHLGQVAVEAAIKQSAIPLEQIQMIFMNATPKLHNDKEINNFVFSNFLKKAKYTPISEGNNNSNMELFIKALELLKSLQQTSLVVGSSASATQNQSSKIKYIKMAKPHTHVYDELLSEVIANYISDSVTRYNKSHSEGVFLSELVPLTVLKQEGNRRKAKEIIQDEIFYDKCVNGSRSLHDCDGAAALVLTTMANAQKLKLSPQAVLIDFEYMQNSADLLSNSGKCVDNLFTKTKLNPQQIHHWEVDDCFPQLIDFFKQYFNLNSDLINPHGGSQILGCSLALSLPRLLTHITHSLKPLEYGCVICSSYQETLALIVQKPLTSRNGLPLVTLYTKDPCPLCDILVEELENNFPGEFELEKVFIDDKANLRFLRLYRFDIPVVFLNNQFLCMHRLNHRLLRKRLDLIKRYIFVKQEM